MANLLENAKQMWIGAADYDQLQTGESRLVGVEADGNVFAYNGDENFSTIDVVGGVIVTKTPLGPTYKLTTSASFMHIVNNDSVSGIDTVDVNIFEGYAEAEAKPLYLGAGIGFTLAGGEASIFDFNLGVGLSTGIGLKEGSVEIKVAGTGVTFGRKISISVLDNSFGIDLARTADAVWLVGEELAAAVAIVPGALKDGGEDLLSQLAAIPGIFADASKDLLEGISQIPGAFATIPAAFIDGGKKLVGAITDAVSSVAHTVADVTSTVVHGVADAASTVAHGIADGADKVVKGIKSIFD